MLPDQMEHCNVSMNSWDMSGAFWSFSKCNITIPHLPADPSTEDYLPWATVMGHCISASYARFAPRQSRGLEAAAATFRGSEPSMKSNVRAARDACG